MDKLLERYERNKLELKKIHFESTEENKLLTNKKDKIHWEYEDKIRALQSECRNKEYEIDEKLKELKEHVQNKREPINKEIKNTEVLFNLIDIYLNNYKLDQMDIDSAIEVIVDNQYRKMALFIGQTNKPKNKYTLYIKAESIFENLGFYFDKEIKCAPSEKALLEYWEKNSHKLKEFIFQPVRPYEYAAMFSHEEIEEMYEKAKELYTRPDWEKAYLEYKKHYYEHNYSHGVDTEMYKAVIERLKILDTEKDRLPLLIAEIKTEEGKKYLAKKLGN